MGFKKGRGGDDEVTVDVREEHGCGVKALARSGTSQCEAKMMPEAMDINALLGGVDMAGIIILEVQ